MAKIAIDIADLESILTNFKHEHTPDEIVAMEHDLRRLRRIQDLWDSLEDTPINPETECIDAPFTVKDQSGHTSATKTFPAGTHRKEIWHWFENTFHVSVAVDLMD